MSLSESQFERLADGTLNEMVECLADMEDDAFDVELESGVLTIAFADGAKYVVNSHRAARQIWMAADASAWHFDWNGTEWRASKGDGELWSLLETRLAGKLDRPVEIRRK
ncbi:MAG TPA: iron donor protein CyaY [Myxococcales bacterium LLY-WYZ-16_1]|nr:iron donor protein CyaY [Myxococcales bacterium LLY-WYZ-16_1]